MGNNGMTMLEEYQKVIIHTHPQENNELNKFTNLIDRLGDLVGEGGFGAVYEDG